MKKLILSLIIIMQSVAMCMASEDTSEDAFRVTYQLVFARDLQNVLNLTNTPCASNASCNDDVYVVGSIVGKKGMMQGGRPMIEIAFSSERQKTLKGTSRVGWVSIAKPVFFLVRLGSSSGELADLDVRYEVSVVMRK